MAYSYTTNNPQTLNNNNTSFSTGTIAYNYTSLTANSILYGFVWLAPGVTLTSVTDNQGNTYTIVGPSASSGGFQGWGLYCNNSVTTASNAYVTLNFTGGPSAAGCLTQFGELLGGPLSSPLATSNTATGSASAPTLNLAGLSAGSCIVAGTINGSSVSPGNGSGYTASGSNNGTYGYGCEYNLSSASGTVTVNFTGSATWNEVALAFSPLGGGGGLPLQAGILT